MTPEVSDFIPSLLEDTDKHIEVVEIHHVTAGGKVQVGIKMWDNHGDPSITTLHNVLLAPYLCNIITVINSIHTSLFHKGFFILYFGGREKNTVTLPHSAQRNHAFWGEIKEI